MNFQPGNFTATIEARLSDDSTEPIVNDCAIELQMYNNALKDVSSPSAGMSTLGTVDGDGCKSADRQDMLRMGKQQEFKVSELVLLWKCSRLILLISGCSANFLFSRSLASA